MVDNKDPYAAFRADETPKEEAFAKLSQLLSDLADGEKAVYAAEDVLKKAQEARRQLDEFDIPSYMDTLDLKEFTNKSGVKMEIKSIVRASIGNRKAQAFAWLIKNGHSGLIKRTVMVAFNANQGPDAEKLLKELREKDLGAGAKQEMKVEAASLTAWVRKRLKAGDEVPNDIFGVYEQRSTKVTLPRE